MKTDSCHAVCAAHARLLRCTSCTRAEGARTAAGRDARHPRQRDVIHRRPQRLDLGEAAADGLQALDRDDLREVAATVERGAPAHRERSIEQRERRVVANRPFIRDGANLAVLRRGEGGDPRGALLDQLAQGPLLIHESRFDTVSFTVK